MLKNSILLKKSCFSQTSKPKLVEFGVIKYYSDKKNKIFNGGAMKTIPEMKSEMKSEMKPEMKPEIKSEIKLNKENSVKKSDYKPIKNQTNPETNPELNPEINSDTWYKKISISICDFIKENYGFFLIISLIIILLYVRYIEVNKRKEQIKKIQIEKEQKISKKQRLNDRLRYNRVI